MADPTETQSDWFTETNPNLLLEAARPLVKVTSKFDAARQRRSEIYERRVRLFGCACARMVWDILPTDARNAVATAERFAYGNATRTDLRAASIRVTRAAITYQQHAICAAGHAATATFGPEVDEISLEPAPTLAALSAAKALATRAAGQSGNPKVKNWYGTWNTVYNAARAQQAELVRDIFPPPGHAVRALRCDPSWLTPTVLTLARQADDAGEYGLLPILADALQDAGCDNEFILDRCRASLCKSGKPPGSPNAPPGTELHSRGNWVVDLLLGRE